MASRRLFSGIANGVAQNFGLKAFSILLAMVLYLFVTVESDATADVEYPVEYYPDEDKVVIGSYPRSIRATLTGPFAPFVTYRSTDLDPIIVDLRGVDAGEVRQRIDFGDVVAPASLSVVGLAPQDFVVTIDNLIAREVSIVDNIVDRPPDGYKITEVRLKPDKVEVEGPESMVQTLTFVRTRPIEVGEATETFELEVELQGLAAPQRMKKRKTQATVVIEEEFVTRTFQAKVAVRAPEGIETTVQPAKVRLSVTGPMRLINELSDDTIDAVVDVAEEALAGEKLVTKTVAVENLPERSDLTELAPEVQVRLRRLGPRAQAAP